MKGHLYYVPMGFAIAGLISYLVLSFRLALYLVWYRAGNRVPQRGNQSDTLASSLSMVGASGLDGLRSEDPRGS